MILRLSPCHGQLARAAGTGLEMSYPDRAAMRGALDPAERARNAVEPAPLPAMLLGPRVSHVVFELA